MAMSRLTDASKTTNSPVDYETVNNLIAEMKAVYDTFVTNHTNAGVHDDDLLPRGRGRVTFSGGTPTLAQSWGIVASIADTATGVVTVTLGTPSSSTTGIMIAGMVESNAANAGLTYSVTDTSTVVIRLLDRASEAPIDVNFTFAVWID